MINDDSGRTLSSAPKIRVCHICGRQYGVHSFEIHLRQCKDLWTSREALKEKNERKILPPDPSGNNESDLDELNRLANEIYNTVSLSTCLHCGRSFLTERLILHNRSCTFDNPGKRAPTRVELSAEDIERKEFQRKEVERKDLLKISERKPKPQWNLRRSMSSGSTSSDALGRRSQSESRDKPCSSVEAVTERVRTSTYESSTISSASNRRQEIKGNGGTQLSRMGSMGKIHQEANANFNPRTRSGASPSATVNNGCSKKISDSPDKGITLIVVEPDLENDFSCSPGVCSVLNDSYVRDNGGKYDDGYDYVIDHIEIDSQTPMSRESQSSTNSGIKSQYDDDIDVGNEIDGVNKMMQEHEFASKYMHGDGDTSICYDKDNAIKNTTYDEQVNFEEHKSYRENEIEMISKNDQEVEKITKNEEIKSEKCDLKKEDSISHKLINIGKAAEKMETKNATKITEMESLVADLRETINEMKSLIKEVKTKENGKEKAKCLCVIS